MAALESLETSFQKVKHLTQIKNDEEYANYMDFLDKVEKALPGDAAKFVHTPKDGNIPVGLQFTAEMYDFLKFHTILSGNFFRTNSKLPGEAKAKLNRIQAIKFGDIGIGEYNPKYKVFETIYNGYEYVLLSDGREVLASELFRNEKPKRGFSGGKTRRRRKHSRKSKRQRS